MIYIKKGIEPNKFLQYRFQINARFDDMDLEVKEQLREALLKEQGYLCAYCMGRISGEGDVKIEHLEARTPKNELQYQNLLAVCKGGEGMPPAFQTCDTRKGKKHLCISPLNQSDMNRIYYNHSGEIHSSDEEADAALEDCLNLNYENGAPFLGRRAALKKFQQLLQPYKDKKGKRAFLEKMQKRYSEHNESLSPYIGILRWYLDKKLKQM